MTTEGFGACKQECANGDWTAAIGSIAAFYAKSTVDCHNAQCQTASIASGHDCCSKNVTCVGDCNLAIAWSDLPGMLKKAITQHDFTTVSNPLGDTELAAPIEKRNPVIAVMQAPSTMPGQAASTHIVVVLGYHGILWEGGQIAFEFLVADSLTGTPAWIGYDDLVNYQGAKWAYTAY
jgi:hypothetical protein